VIPYGTLSSHSDAVLVAQTAIRFLTLPKSHQKGIKDPFIRSQLADEAKRLDGVSVSFTAFILLVG